MTIFGANTWAFTYRKDYTQPTLGTNVNNLKIYASEIRHPAFENSRFDLTESIYHFIFVFCDQSGYMFASRGGPSPTIG